METTPFEPIVLKLLSDPVWKTVEGLRLDTLYFETNTNEMVGHAICDIKIHYA